MEVRCFDLVITRNAGQWIVVDNIRYRLSTPQNVSCCWAAFSYRLVVTSDAVRLSPGLQYVHGLSYNTKMLLSSNCRCWPTRVMIISNRLLITSIFFFACKTFMANNFDFESRVRRTYSLLPLLSWSSTCIGVRFWAGRKFFLTIHLIGCMQFSQTLHK